MHKPRRTTSQSKPTTTATLRSKNKETIPQPNHRTSQIETRKTNDSKQSQAKQQRKKGKSQRIPAKR